MRDLSVFFEMYLGKSRVIAISRLLNDKFSKMTCTKVDEINRVSTSSC